MRRSGRINPEEAAELQNAMSERGTLLIWTVTQGTSDLGENYAARPHSLRNKFKAESVALNMYLMASTLNELRTMLPPGLTHLGRQPEDDPVIVEVWL